jgi:hypothetical protein
MEMEFRQIWENFKNGVYELDLCHFDRDIRKDHAAVIENNIIDSRDGTR